MVEVESGQISCDVSKTNSLIGESHFDCVFLVNTHLYEFDNSEDILFNHTVLKIGA